MSKKRSLFNFPWPGDKTPHLLSLAKQVILAHFSRSVHSKISLYLKKTSTLCKYLTRPILATSLLPWYYCEQQCFPKLKHFALIIIILIFTQRLWNIWVHVWNQQTILKLVVVQGQSVLFFMCISGMSQKNFEQRSLERTSY